MFRSDDDSMFEYELDATDRIRDVSDRWLDFARENDAAHLTREAVVGHSVWDFIADDRTRHLYAQLFERARDYGQVLCVPFRCDSPDFRRFMELDIVSRADGGLVIESRLLCEEPREPVWVRRSAGPVIQMCGWCKKVRTDDDTWVEIEEAANPETLATRPGLDISHVTCPACYSQARAQLGLDC
jgi:hypothetical protein